MKEFNPWKVLNTEIKYENAWISVEHIDVINPSGNQGIYGKVHFKNLAVGVIPLDENNNTWIVGQYRFPLDIYSWEIPEGGAPFEEDALSCAKRELKEETGLVAEEWKEILTLHTSNSVSDEKAVIYLARHLSLGQSQPEETEDLQIRKIPFEELFQITMNGEITDAMSVAAILKLHHLIMEEKRSK